MLIYQNKISTVILYQFSIMALVLTDVVVILSRKIHIHSFLSLKNEIKPRPSTFGKDNIKVSKIVLVYHRILNKEANMSTVSLFFFA